MNTTLEYVFRAAMGQCSTIPMSTDPTSGNENQGSNNNGGGGAYDYSSNKQQQMGTQQRDDEAMEDCVMSDDMSGNSATPLINVGGRTGSRMKRRDGGTSSSPHVQKIFTAVKDSVGGGGNNKYLHTNMDPTSPMSAGNQYNMNNTPMFHQPNVRPIVLPPDAAVRTRCYRLNLNAPISLTLPSASGNDKVLGPYECSDAAAQGDQAVDENPAYVGFSPTLDDLTSDDYDRTITISTARIFRGLRIEPDGSVVSMHHRSKGGGPKRDEKSRQSAKIDKAVDAVDDQVKSNGASPVRRATGEDEKSDEPAEVNMVSIVIFGEYDDMKSLVRDGARRLKDNQTSLDDAMWAMNKQRHSAFLRPPMSPSESSWYGGMTPDSSAGRSNATRRSSSIKNLNSNGSQPPKLHRHPRDRPGSTSRREMAQNASRNNKSGTGKRFPPWRKADDDSSGMGGGGESDWSDALQFSKGLYSMCVCGANSVSPTSGGSSNYYETNPNNKTMAAVGNVAMPTPMANEGREPSTGSNNNVYNGAREGVYNGSAKETILV